MILREIPGQRKLVFWHILRLDTGTHKKFSKYGYLPVLSEINVIINTLDCFYMFQPFVPIFVWLNQRF